MKAIITTDLGYGDSGKGTIVDSLVHQYESKLVVRYNGGFQAAHTVYNDSQVHTFRQYGSGTLAGASTLIGPDVIINPLVMQAEALALSLNGVVQPNLKMWVCQDCLITTPYHMALNQIRELSRSKRHGSTGN